jgi:hypothetical protein
LFSPFPFIFCSFVMDGLVSQTLQILSTVERRRSVGYFKIHSIIEQIIIHD